MKKDKDYLRKRFYVIYEFYRKDYRNNVLILDELKKLVERSFASNNLKSLVKINKEMDKMIRESYPPERKRIEENLSKLDDEIYLDENDRMKEIEKVLKSGGITNDREYKLLLDYVEELFRENRDMDKVNHMLELYKKK